MQTRSYVQTKQEDLRPSCGWKAAGKCEGVSVPWEQEKKAKHTHKKELFPNKEVTDCELPEKVVVSSV